MKLYLGTSLEIWNKKTEELLEKLSGLCLSLANNMRGRTADVCLLCVLKQHAVYYLIFLEAYEKE
jgi:hypothetical protein